jgi:hydrogenase maturation protease
MKTLVVGLGNPILGDDGIGIRVARAIANTNCVADSKVEFLEASLGGLALAEQLQGYDRVILVDAIQTRGGKPGAVYRLNLDDLPSYHADSIHDTSLATALQVFRHQGGHVPSQITIIAIEAVNLHDFGETLTPEVEAAIPFAMDAVLAELETYGTGA